MTGWTLETAARHIPEEELHAYLDQALSRSQCVEIECHLAECRRCQIERNHVAAVRDRTTALLAEATPGRLRAPAYEVLVAQHEARRSARLISLARLRRVGMLAAGLLAVVGASWVALRGPVEPTTVASTLAPKVPALTIEPQTDRVLVAAGPVNVALDGNPSPMPAPAIVPTRTRNVMRLAATTASEPVLQVTALPADDDAFALDGLWQTVDLREAQVETAGNLPRIDGLPVVDIQLQRGTGDARPVVIVSQQHPSGRIIRTIEGPEQRVEELLGRQAGRAPAQWRASLPKLTQPDYQIGGGGSAKRGLRIFSVTGNLPADSLNALAGSIDLKE